MEANWPLLLSDSAPNRTSRETEIAQASFKIWNCWYNWNPWMHAMQCCDRRSYSPANPSLLDLLELGHHLRYLPCPPSSAAPDTVMSVGPVLITRWRCVTDGRLVDLGKPSREPLTGPVDIDRCTHSTRPVVFHPQSRGLSDSHREQVQKWFFR